MQPEIAVVTGGSSGIGQAIAVALAGEGFAVAVVGSNEQRIAKTLELLDGTPATQTGKGHLGLALDVTAEADMDAMVRQTVAHFGRLDVLVASAGIGKRSDSDRYMPHPTAELPLDEWRAVIDVNLTGIFLSNRAVVPGMLARGQGHIINVCSSTTPHGLRGTPFGPAYCASKFGVVGFSEALAQEVERDGVRVQVVFPGPVETPLVDQTILARPFGGAIAAEHFAATVVALLRQPTDSVIVHPHVLPFRGAFKRGRGGRHENSSQKPTHG